MEKFKLLISHKPRLLLLLVIALALSLPFVVSQVLHQQELSQHAASASPVTFSFSTTNATVPVGQDFEFDMILNAGSDDIGSLQFNLKYDPTLISLTEIGQPTDLKVVNNPTTVSGMYSPVMINTSLNQITGNQLRILIFQVHTLAPGTATISVQDTMHPTDTNSTAFVTVDNQSSIVKTFTITNAQPTIETTPTGGPTTCTHDSGRDAGCPCQTRNQCASNYCQFPTGGPNPSGTLGTCILLPTETVFPTGPTTTPTNTPTATPTTAQATATPTSTPTATSVPTVTSAPTATPIPNDTTLELLATLPGIGSGAQNLGLNNAPIHPQRSATVVILSGQNVPVKTITGSMQYDSTGGFYRGTFSLGPDFASGSYTAKLKFNNTLYKAYPGIIQITKGQLAASTSPTVNLIPGDLIPDNTLSVEDFNSFEICSRELPACTADLKIASDFNDDGQVDGADGAILTRSFLSREGD